MNKIKKFFITTFLGGVLVVLPVVILVVAFHWLFNFITGLISPLTKLLINELGLGKLFADCLVIAIITLACFTVGVFVRTKFGKITLAALEELLLHKIPGYKLVKETVIQLLGQKKSPFSAVALAKVFGNETMVTCFVTDRRTDGSCTVFIPLGPAPTQGAIVHLDKDSVFPIDVSVEDAMRSIISCGAGSQKLIEAYKNTLKK